MGQSYSCLTIKSEKEESNIILPLDDTCANDYTLKPSQSSPAQSTKREIVRGFQQCKSHMKSESSHKRRARCIDSIHDPNTNYKKSELPAQAAEKSHDQTNEHQLTGDTSLNTRNNNCRHSRIGNLTLPPFHPNTSDSDLTKDEGNIDQTNRNDNEVKSISTDTTTLSKSKRVHGLMRLAKFSSKKNESHPKSRIVREPPNNGGNKTTVQQKTRKPKKFPIKNIFISRKSKLISEEKIHGNNDGTPPILPHPITLEIGPNYYMQFVYEKRKKIKRMTKGKGKRKHGIFSKPPKDKAEQLSRMEEWNLPKAVKTKTHLVIKNEVEVVEYMETRMAETGFKNIRNKRSIPCGKHIFATRHFEHSDENNNSKIDAEINTDINQDQSLNKVFLNGTTIYYLDEEKDTDSKSEPCILSSTNQMSNNNELNRNDTAERERICTPCTTVCETIDDEAINFHSIEKNQEVDFFCEWFLISFPSTTEQLIDENKDNESETKKKCLTVAIPKGIAPYVYMEHCLLNMYMKPVEEITCIDRKHQIYVGDIGLTSSQCDLIVNVSEFCSSGAYSSYIYAKQTIGCRKYDALATVCECPVMRAVATVQRCIEIQCDKVSGINNDFLRRDLILGEREPHVVKYDVSKIEHQKLDMHTDKSEWTFLIALSEGNGCDYEGGGTYFEGIHSTVHLQKGHVMFFPGRLRHRAHEIVAGKRYLLVGFLVERSFDIPYLFY